MLLAHILFKFLVHYQGTDDFVSNDRYLTNNRRLINTLFGRYVVFLMSGFTIKDIPILVGTIQGYLDVVNGPMGAKDLM